MKVFSPLAMLTLLEASDNERQAAAALHEQFAPYATRNDGWLERAVTSGKLFARKVTVNEVPAYMIWFAKSDGCLWIHAVQSYDNGFAFDYCSKAIDQLQAAYECSHVRFLSIRAELVTWAMNHGYRVEGLVMIKS